VHKSDIRNNNIFFNLPRTETAINVISNSTWYPNLNTPEKILDNVKKEIWGITDSREGLELLRGIDFTFFRSDQFEETYYYLENCNFSEEAIDFLMLIELMLYSSS